MRGPYSWLSGGWKPSSEDTDSPSQLMGGLRCPKGRTRRWCQEGEVTIIFPPSAVWAPVLAASAVSLPPCHRPPSCPSRILPMVVRARASRHMDGAWGGGASREQSPAGTGRLSRPDVCVEVQPWATSPDAAHSLGCSLAHPSPTVPAAPRAGGSGPLGGAQCPLSITTCSQSRQLLPGMDGLYPPLDLWTERGSPRDQSPAHLSIY